MRRLAATIGPLCASLSLIVTVPTPAHAARGVLTINNTRYPDPVRQCIYDITSPQAPNYIITNDTDQTVSIRTTEGGGSRCTGDTLVDIPPGEWRGGAEHIYVLSVWIPA